MRNFRFFGVWRRNQGKGEKRKNPAAHRKSIQEIRKSGNPEIQSLLLFRVMPLRCDALMLAPIHNIHNKAW